MRLSRPMRFALLVLIPLLAFGAYELGLYVYGNYHYRAAEKALDRREFQEASTHLDKCLEVAPNDPDTRLLAAQAARRRGDWDLAGHHLHLLQKSGGPADALELEHRLMRAQQGDLGEVRALLAYAFRYRDRADTPLVLEGCVEGTLKAMAVDYSAPSVFATPQRRPDVDRALEAVELWLRSRPGRADQAEGLCWRARLYALLNDPDNARTSARQALEQDPDHFDARFYLAIYVAQEAPADAAAHFQKLHDRHPDNRRVLFALATVRRALGQQEEAREILDEMLATNPTDYSALLERGRLALDVQQPERGEVWLRRAFGLMPDEPEVNLALSTCLQMQGRGPEAKEFRDRFTRLDAERERQKEELRQRALAAP